MAWSYPVYVDLHLQIIAMRHADDPVMIQQWETLEAKLAKRARATGVSDKWLQSLSLWNDEPDGPLQFTVDTFVIPIFASMDQGNKRRATRVADALDNAPGRGNTSVYL